VEKVDSILERLKYILFSKVSCVDFQTSISIEYIALFHWYIYGFLANILLVVIK